MSKSKSKGAKKAAKKKESKKAVKGDPKLSQKDAKACLLYTSRCV